MNYGVVYPQTEFGNDPIAIRDFAQTAEELGFTHILAYEHILGFNPNRPGGLKGLYTHQDAFLEPFVLFSFLAGQTRNLEFVTDILVLPQRQTALVAKQAACLDILSGGRLRLGVGVGWNDVEFIALNQEYHNRGRRIEEQVEVLRLLWSHPVVNFEGEWHKILSAGLNPMPLQGPIPIWFGGIADRALERAARLGDGWMPSYRTPVAARPALDKLDQYLENAGRIRTRPGQAPDGGFGVEASISYGEGDPDDWWALIDGWKQSGVTHISFDTLDAGFSSAHDYIQAIHKIARVVGLG